MIRVTRDIRTAAGRGTVTGTRWGMTGFEIDERGLSGGGHATLVLSDEDGMNDGRACNDVPFMYEGFRYRPPR